MRQDLQEFDAEFVFCARCTTCKSLSGWGITARMRVSDLVVDDVPGRACTLTSSATGGQDRLRIQLEWGGLEGAVAPIR